MNADVYVDILKSVAAFGGTDARLEREDLMSTGTITIDGAISKDVASDLVTLRFRNHGVTYKFIIFDPEIEQLPDGTYATRSPLARKVDLQPVILFFQSLEGVLATQLGIGRGILTAFATNDKGTALADSFDAMTAWGMDLLLDLGRMLTGLSVNNNGQTTFAPDPTADQSSWSELVKLHKIATDQKMSMRDAARMLLSNAISGQLVPKGTNLIEKLTLQQREVLAERAEQLGMTQEGAMGRILGGALGPK